MSSSQELVNLVLTGRCVSNVFDGEKSLSAGNDSFKMHGIAQINDIGYLTLLEALCYTTVGKHLKSPLYPIWLIGSDSHYTVIFALDKNIGTYKPLTEEQQMMMTAQLVFQQFDPEQNGFITVQSLSAVLAALDVHQDMHKEIEKKVDPEQLGIVLWPTMSNTLLVRNIRTPAMALLPDCLAKF